MTQAIQVKKLQKVEVPEKHQKEEGCVAFQKVQITYCFYGKQMTELFDTKMLANGKQMVISGNGFIKDNFEIV